MKKEINILKKKYQQVTLPYSEDSGLENLWERIDKKQYFQFFYLPRFAIVTILICILATGFIGAASASKPGTALYPIKVLSQKAVKSATRVLPPQIEKGVNALFAPEAPTLTPTLAPVATPTDVQDTFEPEDKNNESTGHDSSNNDVETTGQINNKNQDSNGSENVKGAETKLGNEDQEKSSEINKSSNNHTSEENSGKKD